MKSARISSKLLSLYLPQSLMHGIPVGENKTLIPERRIYRPCLSLSILKVFSCTKHLDGKCFPPSDAPIMFVRCHNYTYGTNQTIQTPQIKLKVLLHNSAKIKTVTSVFIAL
jgi:hypothetical protein